MIRSPSGYNKTKVLSDTGPHPRYHFHGYAGDQISGDGKFFDRSPLGNHAVRGANLSDAQMLGSSGYAATTNPVSGATDTSLRIPNLNFNYNAGEKLVIYWLGKVNAEAGPASLLGDGYTATYPGVRVRVNTNMTLQLVVYDVDNGGGVFGGSTSVTIADGTLRSFALVLDGAAKKYCMWSDDEVEAAFGGAYLSFGSGAAVDTRNSNTFQIGSAQPSAAGSAAEGTQVYTRALHIIRQSATDTVPPVSVLTSAFKALRANPDKPILGSAF